MTEQPLKNLEYSKYDEMAKAEKIAADMKKKVLEMEGKVKDYQAEIERIKIDSTYEEKERAEAIADYERMVGFVQETIQIAKESIKLAGLLGNINQIGKEQANELLEKGEHMDPLTADIEGEDEPPRRVN